MMELILVGIFLLIAVVIIISLLKSAFKIALAVVLIALVVFGGIYLFAGKKGLDKSMDITGAAVKKIKESEIVRGLTEKVKDTAGNILEKSIEKGKEKGAELIREEILNEETSEGCKCKD